MSQRVQDIPPTAVGVVTAAGGSGGLWLQSYTEMANNMLVFVNLLLALGGLMLLGMKLHEKVSAWRKKKKGK